MRQLLYSIGIISLIFLSTPSATAQNTGQFPWMVDSTVSEAIQPNELRIVSWNIQMLPRLITRVRRGPMKRARLIPQKLIDDKADIIVFQEAFDVRARRLLKRGLQKTYPYKVGPANNKFFTLKTNSGVMIFSKILLKQLGTVDYTQCEKEDCLAHKGVLLVEGDWHGQKFQVMGTHMEAGGSPELKQSQYAEAGALLDSFAKPGVPQFLCGDYNTKLDDSNLYPKLLAALKCENGPMYGPQAFTSDEITNTMNIGPGKREVIDFIFYRGNGIQHQSMMRTVRTYKYQWSEQYGDLSDHYAVLARIVFKPQKPQQ